MEEWTGPDAPQEPPREPGLVTGVAYGLFVVLGVLLGLVGSFEFSWTAGSVPVAAILLAAADFAAFRFAGWAMESRLGVATVAVPWLIVVVLLSSRRPEGDLVVTGTAAGYIFIFGGSIAAVAAIAATRSSRPWMLRGVPSAPAPRD
ncbi:DUF6113 family protein [Actinoallomurus purpureus]|uniref:DUF6113 family protein n=1 Tax=Actinoallomurus purpureus TaxID=478114 RepID=UPI002092E1E4|nr:DUF6113 family protein [Actinoallomurus purpureus]MCO6006588.1 DUF6113 family protein [Actinoallomurus purpureus]